MRLSVIFSSLLIAALTTTSAFTIPSLHDISASSTPLGFLLTRRQTTKPATPITKSTSTSTSNFNSISNATSPRYEAAILTSCATALSLLAGAPESASGMSLCYNILSLNNSTGVFKSDLRLFKVSEPRDSWRNTTLKNVVPKVDWRGSGASLMAGQWSSSIQNTSARGGASMTRRKEDGEVRGRPDGKGLILMESYAFIGQINPEFLNRTMNSSNLQALVTPIVSLSVTGRDTSTTLSTSEAAFLVNVFSATPKTAKPFVLPGVTIQIFPIGLIVTGSWTLIFATVIGWGAVKKMQFREHYRRRIARDEAVGGRRMRI